MQRCCSVSRLCGNFAHHQCAPWCVCHEQFYQVPDTATAVSVVCVTLQLVALFAFLCGLVSSWRTTPYCVVLTSVDGCHQVPMCGGTLAKLCPRVANALRGREASTAFLFERSRSNVSVSAVGATCVVGCAMVEGNTTPVFCTTYHSPRSGRSPQAPTQCGRLTCELWQAPTLAPELALMQWLTHRARDQ